MNPLGRTPVRSVDVALGALAKQPLKVRTSLRALTGSSGGISQT